MVGEGRRGATMGGGAATVGGAGDLCDCMAWATAPVNLNRHCDLRGLRAQVLAIRNKSNAIKAGVASQGPSAAPGRAGAALALVLRPVRHLALAAAAGEVGEGEDECLSGQARGMRRCSPHLTTAPMPPSSPPTLPAVPSLEAPTALAQTQRLLAAAGAACLPQLNNVVRHGPMQGFSGVL